MIHQPTTKMTDYKKPKHAEIINDYFSFKQSIMNWSYRVYFVMATTKVRGLDFNDVTARDIPPLFDKIKEDLKDFTEDAVMGLIKFQHILNVSASEELSKNVLTMCGVLHNTFGKQDETFEDIIRSIVCLVKDE